MSSKSNRRRQPARYQTAQRPQQTTRNAASPTPSRTGPRATLERISAGPLVMLHTMPRWLFPIMLATALFFGLLLSGTWAWLGAVLLGLVSLVVIWLTALSWPVLTPGSRFARVIVSAAMVGVTVLKLMGRF